MSFPATACHGVDGEVELWAGGLSAVTPLVAAFVSPFWGRVADRRGRKLMVLRSCFAIALFIGLMSLGPVRE